EPKATRQSSPLSGLLRFARNDEWGQPSSKQAVDEPVGRSAAPVASEAFAVDPVATALSVLDAVIIAQPRARRLPPPFGRDPLGAFRADDVMDRAAPDEASRHPFGRRINDVDRLGPVEEFLRSPPLHLQGRGTMQRRLHGGGVPPSRFARHLPSKSRGGDYTHPPARPFRQVALLRLRLAYRPRSELHRQPVDQSRDVSLARWLLDQAILRGAQIFGPVRLQRERIEAELRV